MSRSGGGLGSCGSFGGSDLCARAVNEVCNEGDAADQSEGGKAEDPCGVGEEHLKVRGEVLGDTGLQKANNQGE